MSRCMTPYPPSVMGGRLAAGVPYFRIARAAEKVGRPDEVIYQALPRHFPRLGGIAGRNFWFGIF